MMSASTSMGLWWFGSDGIGVLLYSDLCESTAGREVDYD